MSAAFKPFRLQPERLTRSRKFSTLFLGMDWLSPLSQNAEKAKVRFQAATGGERTNP
jgi:hypothetical protein